MLGILGGPQLLGMLAYRRIKKRNDFAAHLLGLIIPPILFFSFSWARLLSSTASIEASGERVCGTYSGMMGLGIMFITCVQAVAAIVIQISLHEKHRTCVITKQV